MSFSPSIPEDTHIDVGEVPMSRGYWRESGGRLLADGTGMVSAAILIVFALLALTAPFLATHVTGYTPDQQDLLHTFAPAELASTGSAPTSSAATPSPGSCTARA